MNDALEVGESRNLRRVIREGGDAEVWVESIAASGVEDLSSSD